MSLFADTLITLFVGPFADTLITIFVGPFTDNLGLFVDNLGPILFFGAKNVGRKIPCLWVLNISFVGRNS